MTPTKNESLPDLPANVADALRTLIERYWMLAHAEGAEGRDHDTENGDASLCLYEIEKRLKIVDALTREAHTEGVSGGPVFAGYDPGKDDREAEDYHVIMTMGRLLAAIAISVKGPGPAGTAWSYHDLPDIVAALQEAAEQVADEMTAWAATKMADRGSSRRDRMMISEWAKRLRNPEYFPVKDFEVEGTTLTKEEMRAIVRKVIATPPAPQRLSSNPSGLSSESAPQSSEQRHPDALEDGSLSKSTAKRLDTQLLAQGEGGPSWRYAVVSALEYLRAGDSEQARDMLESALRMDATQPPHQNREEQRAFESWAEGVGLPMEQHPLHYLFLDPVTHAARQAWKAALEHAALTEAKQQGPGEAHWVHEAAQGLRSLINCIDTQSSTYGKSHLLSMLNRMRDEPMSDTKACRWLGWIQCALVVHRIVSLTDMKEYNQRFSEAAPQVEAKRQTGGDA